MASARKIIDSVGSGLMRLFTPSFHSNTGTEAHIVNGDHTINNKIHKENDLPESNSSVPMIVNPGKNETTEYANDISFGAEHAEGEHELIQTIPRSENTQYLPPTPVSMENYERQTRNSTHLFSEQDTFTQSHATSGAKQLTGSYGQSLDIHDCSPKHPTRQILVTNKHKKHDISTERHPCPITNVENDVDYYDHVTPELRRGTCQINQNKSADSTDGIQMQQTFTTPERSLYKKLHKPNKNTHLTQDEIDMLYEYYHENIPTTGDHQRTLNRNKVIPPQVQNQTYQGNSTLVQNHGDPFHKNPNNRNEIIPIQGNFVAEPHSDGGNVRFHEPPSTGFTPSSSSLTRANEASSRSKRREKEPDTYSGTNVEWPDYICHFEQVANWNLWTEKEKAAQLAISLRGSAQKVLSELTAEDLSDYSRLKSALTQRFCPPERETAHRCEFRSRRRNQSESAAEYGYSLKRIASRAFPQIPMLMRESLIIEQYVSGLGNAELKRYVQFSHPASLDKAIALAVEFEAFEGTQNPQYRKPKPEGTANVFAVKDTTATKQKDEPNITDLAESIKAIERTLATLTNSYASNYSTPRSRDSRSVRCYICQKEGHISRNCPTSNVSRPGGNNQGRNTNTPNAYTPRQPRHDNLN